MSQPARTRIGLGVKITALGTYVPPRLLTNAALEKMVDTTDEWITTRTGIRERHIVDKGVATSDLAVAAARNALAARGLAPTDIEAIVVGTVTPDMFFPSTACLVQDKLGANGAWGFDLSGACSAFVYALQAGAQFVVDRCAQTSSGDRRRRDVFDHRLHRSRHLHPVWRWRRRRVSSNRRTTIPWV